MFDVLSTDVLTELCVKPQKITRKILHAKYFEEIDFVK